MYVEIEIFHANTCTYSLPLINKIELRARERRKRIDAAYHIWCDFYLIIKLVDNLCVHVQREVE